MNNRPTLDPSLDSKTFRSYYYLKAELTDFCRQHQLQPTGSKAELTERIATFLDTGEKTARHSHPIQRKHHTAKIALDATIGPNFVCTEQHRAFYEAQIGKSFSFNVAFQKWLKSNPDKTYRDSITAYHQILTDKKQTKSAIGKQFEYNTYIRDFFAANPGKSLTQAITCWNYKKLHQGSHRYENSDLEAL